MVSLSMTLSGLRTGFQGHNIFGSPISEKRARLKDKDTIAQEGKYLPYRMVLCLATLTDL